MGEKFLKIDIERAVQSALSRIYERDADLLRNDVNERTITHKLAEYLASEFPKWHVDCEYNRNHDKTKRLKSLQPRTVKIDNTDGISVFPDIIVHKRMTDENLLVIEVKKSTSSVSQSFDIEKLLAFKDELHYQYALFLCIKTGEGDLGVQVSYLRQSRRLVVCWPLKGA